MIHGEALGREVSMLKTGKSISNKQPPLPDRRNTLLSLPRNEEKFFDHKTVTVGFQSQSKQNRYSTTCTEFGSSREVGSVKAI